MAHDFDVESYEKQKSAVWRVTVWLTVITIVEVAVALLFGETIPRMLLNFFFVVMSLLKAFFIVGEFMHVKYETRALMMTLIAPTFFLIWFIIAFLWEGSEWLSLRRFWDVL